MQTYANRNRGGHFSANVGICFQLSNLRNYLEKLPEFYFVLSKYLSYLRELLKKLYFATNFQPIANVAENFILLQGFVTRHL